MTKINFQDPAIPEGWSDDPDDLDYSIADDYLEHSGLCPADLIMCRLEDHWTLLRSGSEYVFYNGDGVFYYVLEPRNIADIMPVLHDEYFYWTLHLSEVHEPFRDNKTLLETIGWTRAALRGTRKLAQTLTDQADSHESKRQYQRNDGFSAISSEAYTSPDAMDYIEQQVTVGVNDESMTHGMPADSYNQSTTATRTECSLQSYETVVKLPEELLPAHWARDERTLALASRSFPHRTYDLPKCIPILVHDDERNYLVRAGDNFYLYNQPLQDVVRIDQPTDLLQVLENLNNPRPFQVTAMRKPISPVVASKFRLDPKDAFLPCGWYDDFHGCEEVLQYLDLSKYGLQYPTPLMVRKDGRKVLLECDGAYYVKFFEDDIYRVDSPKDLAAILSALEEPETIKISSLTDPIPNDLVPEGWSNGYNGSGPLPNTIQGNNIPNVVLVNPNINTYLLNTSDYDFVLWEEGTNYIIEFEEPSGLLSFLPLLNQPQSLNIRKCAFPSSFATTEIFRKVGVSVRLNEYSSADVLLDHPGFRPLHRGR